MVLGSESEPGDRTRSAVRGPIRCVAFACVMNRRADVDEPRTCHCADEPSSSRCRAGQRRAAPDDGNAGRPALRTSESPSWSQGTRRGKARASVRHLVVRFTNDLSLLSVETSRPGRARYIPPVRTPGRCGQSRRRQGQAVDVPLRGRADKSLLRRTTASGRVTCGRRRSDGCALAFREDGQPPWPTLRLTLLPPLLLIPEDEKG